jgi:apolipoprotein D and lipocalin family protein
VVRQISVGVHTVRMKTISAFFVACAMLVSGTVAFAQSASSAPALQAVASLDVARYMGTWYEIAKYPNSFQAKCVRNTRADYLPEADGKVQVLNRCEMADGKTTEAQGAARQVGPADSPKLQVRFAPAWLSFLPMVWADYWVIDIDPQYQLVAVSEPTREYLWVLSRTKQVDAAQYQALLVRLAERGFDLKRLALSPQD